MALTLKQEKFAQEVAKGATQSDAYRRAYDAKKMKPETVQKRASELMSDREVAGRVADLRRPAAARCEITVERITTDLMEAREKAIENNQSSAAVAASMGIAKLHGLLVEDRKNARDPFEGWSGEQIREALDEAKKALVRAKEVA